jgi:hypothetical protein
MSLPDRYSNGRSDSAPQLRLSYDPVPAMVPFGFGWSLSLPAITRKTDKGLSNYPDAVDSDVFCSLWRRGFGADSRSEPQQGRMGAREPAVTNREWRPRYAFAV